MSLSSKHPAYAALIETWNLLRDSYEGERKVKAEGGKYLPPTTGMRLDGWPAHNAKGTNDYNAYLQRAVFHNFVKEATKMAMGKLHMKPPKIELPPALEPLRDRATVNGDSLDVLHMKINLEQLIVGRIGLMLDLPTTPGLTNLPYIATYAAERIINWDDGSNVQPVVQTLNLVVLDERQYVRGGRGTDQQTGQFEWTEVTQYRVLVLGDTGANEGQGQGVYQAAVFRETDNFSESALEPPNIQGRTLDRIPFVFVNAMDVLPAPDLPPLETLANLGMTAYRTEADYRQSLFMQGQDTLVTIGVADSENIRTGAGAHIGIPTVEGDAKYIGVDSMGLPEQRTAVENDITRAETLSGQFVDRKAGVESGDAMRQRQSSAAITLTDVAIAGARGLENILRVAAEWVGANPDDVVVEPNLDFTDQLLEGKQASDWMAAKNQGLPLSLESIWNNLKQRDVTEFDSFEDEVAQIEAEATLEIAGPAGTGEEDGLDDDDENPDDDDPNANGGGDE